MIQTMILMGAAVVAVITITVYLGGVGAWWPSQWPAHWPDPTFFPRLEYDPNARVTMFGIVLATFVWYVCTAVSDQIAIQLNKHYDDPSPWRHASVLMFSKDEGRSWPKHAVVTSDPENRMFYWDQRPRVFSNGRILDLFWTFDRQQTVYRNIHARESLDHGRTWSEIWDTGVVGQPAPPVPLPDGTTGLVYVDRSGAPQIKMRVSCDRGRTWPRESEIVLERSRLASQTWRKRSMQDAWAEMADFSLGLPATAVAQNGDILVVYYAGPATNQMDIKYVRVRETTAT